MPDERSPRLAPGGARNLGGEHRDAARGVEHQEPLDTAQPNTCRDSLAIGLEAQDLWLGEGWLRLRQRRRGEKRQKERSEAKAQGLSPIRLRLQL